MMGYPNSSTTRSRGGKRFKDGQLYKCHFCLGLFLSTSKVPMFTFPFYHPKVANGSGLHVCFSCQSLIQIDREQPDIIENPFAFVGFHKK